MRQETGEVVAKEEVEADASNSQAGTLSQASEHHSVLDIQQDSAVQSSGEQAMAVAAANGVSHRCSTCCANPWRRRWDCQPQE